MATSNALIAASEPPLFAPDDAQAGALPNLADVVAAIRVSLAWIVGCTVVLGVAGYLVYGLQRPVYASTARVLVQTEQLGAPSFLSGITPYRESQIPEAANRRLETEMALITSKSNALEAVRALGVSEAQLSATPLSQARHWIEAYTPARLRRWREGRSPNQKPSQRQVDALTADTLLANLSVEAVRSKTADTTSNVLEVTLKTVDAAVAPRLLQAVLDAYLRNSGGKSQVLGAATTALLDQQVSDAAAQLDHLETELVRLANRRSSRADGSVPGIDVGGTGRDVSRAANEAAIAQLTTQVIDLQAKVEEQRISFTDDAPSVRALRDRLAAARARLSSTIRSNAADNLDFTRLERQRSLQQDRYLELRRKRDQISLYIQLNPGTMDGREIVDAPTVPDERTTGKSKLPLILGPVAGAMLGLLVAAVRELMNQRLRSSRDVERALGLHTLGRLPRVDRKKVLAVRVATLSRPELKALSRP